MVTSVRVYLIHNHFLVFATLSSRGFYSLLVTKLSTTALCSFSSLSLIHREVDEEEGPFNGREFMYILH